MWGISVGGADSIPRQGVGHRASNCNEHPAAAQDRISFRSSSPFRCLNLHACVGRCDGRRDRHARTRAPQGTSSRTGLHRGPVRCGFVSTFRSPTNHTFRWTQRLLRCSNPGDTDHRSHVRAGVERTGRHSPWPRFRHFESRRRRYAAHDLVCTCEPESATEDCFHRDTPPQSHSAPMKARDVRSVPGCRSVLARR